MEPLSTYSTLAADLEEVIGTEATIKLCEHWPGIPMRVPCRVTPASAIAQVIGLDAARALAVAFGGMPITPPRLRHMMRDVRNRAIAQERKSGASVEQIARRHEMTVRQVYNVLAASPHRRSGDRKGARS